MLITGDTTSKQLSESNPLSLLYGDGAAAILLEKKAGSATIAVETKADGNGFRTMILPGGGFRFNNPLEELKEGVFESSRTFNELNLDEQVFQDFVLSEVPATIERFLSKRKANFGDFDFLAFQQAGSSLMKKLAGVLGLSPEALPANISAYGNTSGSSIPLLLCDKFGKAENKTEIKVLATAFGEGFSWGVTDFRIHASDILPVIETNDFFREGDVNHNF
jgi:3-oxoacyl-[acyl-carrier-protein] synthase-3